MEPQLTVSAPGSIMITGEHAVVHGHPAIVTAIEQRATITVGFSEGDTLCITSQIAPPAAISMAELVAQGPYRFVIAAVRAYRDRLKMGLNIDIHSDIDPTLGLGSSAAVTIATLAALEGAATETLHFQALSIIRDLQGRGSGADLAASLHGGTLSYQIGQEGFATALPLPPPPQLSLFNVGYKTPTAEVLARVAKMQAEDPTMINAIYQEMGDMSEETIELAAQADWASIGPHLTAYQHLMQRLGVSDDALDSAVARAMVANGVIGAKISGSGLGDCVVAIGSVPKGFQPVELAQQGVVFHDNT